MSVAWLGLGFGFIPDYFLIGFGGCAREFFPDYFFVGFCGCLKDVEIVFPLHNSVAVSRNDSR